MKKLALTVVAIVLLTLAGTVCAGEPTTFSSQSEADAAFNSGHFARYVPFARAKNPVRGETKKLETPLLGELNTLHGYRWIVYQPGDELVWGEKGPIGDPRCGNDIRNWAYPRSPATVALTPVQNPTLTLQPGSIFIDSFNTITEVRPAFEAQLIEPTNHHYCGGGCKALIGGGIAAVVVVAIVASSSHHDDDTPKPTGPVVGTGQPTRPAFAASFSRDSRGGKVYYFGFTTSFR